VTSSDVCSSDLLCVRRERSCVCLLDVRGHAFV
jgi:hypothetical protein